MSETIGTSEPVVKDISRDTRTQYSAEEKIRVVLDGLRGGFRLLLLVKLDALPLYVLA